MKNTQLQYFSLKILSQRTSLVFELKLKKIVNIFFQSYIYNHHLSEVEGIIDYFLETVWLGGCLYCYLEILQTLPLRPIHKTNSGIFINLKFVNGLNFFVQILMLHNLYLQRKNLAI